MKINVKLLSALSMLTVAGVASADAPSLGDVLKSSGITATGWVAASYNHFSSAGGQLHQFDIDHNTFSLNQAALSLAYQPDSGFGAAVTTIFGDDAKILTNPSGIPGENSGDVAVTQAFVQYKTGGLTIMAGKLLTIAGAEVIAANGNTNYSRGLLFTNLEPLFHTGVRATYAPTDMVTLTLGLNNGWNNSFDTTTKNTQKTLEAGVTVTPIKELSVALNGYFGNESSDQSATGPGATSLIDLLVTYSPLSNLSFVLNYDNKRVKDVLIGSSRETVKSDGFALYGNWAITDMWRASLRLEQTKDDSNGGVITGIPDEKVKEATLTIGFLPTANAEFDFEVRKDKADDQYFTDFNGSPTDSQTEFALQALYKF